MKQIWKFPLSMIGSQILIMPNQAKILTIQIQQDTPCIWAMVDTEAPKTALAMS